MIKIVIGSPNQTYSLRSEVLGWQNVSTDRDTDSVHWLAISDNEVIVGTLSATMSNCPIIPIKPALHFYAVVVDPAHQGLRIGTMLMSEAQKHAKQNNAELMWAKARESALGFYKGLGYSVDSKPLFDANSGQTNFIVYRYIDHL